VKELTQQRADVRKLFAQKKEEMRLRHEKEAANLAKQELQ
jgi:hypothetical protein